MQKIKVRANPEFTQAWPQAYPFRISVTLRSGDSHVREIRHAKGHPDNPMSDREIEDKFRRLALPVMTQAQVDRALAQLWQLENLNSIRDLMALFELHAD